MKGLSPIYLFMKFVQTDDKIDQSKYFGKILVKFGMEQCKPRSTPCEMKPPAFNSDTEAEDPQMK